LKRLPTPWRGQPPRSEKNVASPQGRTIALACAMGLAGCVLAVFSLRWGKPLAPVSVKWWELAPAVAVSDELGFHLEVRGEAHTFTLSEFPLLLGCLFAAPWAVIVGRLIGDTAFQLLRRKQRGVKLWFNLAMFFLETVLTLVVFHELVGTRSPVDWVSWPLIFTAIALADLVSMVAVSAAIRWHGGQPRLVPVLVAAIATAVANVNLALLAAVLLWNIPYAIVLLVIVLIMTSLAYRGYANLTKRYASLKVTVQGSAVTKPAPVCGDKA
jgi:hypothetical protein